MVKRFDPAAFSSAVQARRTLMAVAGRPRRRPGRVPHALQPDRQRESYFAALKPLVSELCHLVEAELVPHLPALVAEAGYRRDARRLDNWNETLARLLHRIAEQMTQDWPTSRLQDLSQQAATTTSDFQRAELRRQFQSSLGVDPFLREPWLEDRMRSFTHENVRLIKSIPAELLDDLHTRIVHHVRRGGRAEALAEDIRARYGVTERRARLIARDQVGKFYSDLNRERQKEAGVEAFVWTTMGDNRVCDDCEPLNGQRFTWNDPPAEGQPGDCHPDDRCIAQPDLAGFWDSL